MNITNLGINQATIEIFGGFFCLMISVIIMMNGQERKSWKILKKMIFSIAFIFFFEACAYFFRGKTQEFNIFMNRISNFGVFLLNITLVALFIQYMYDLLQEKGATPGKIYKYIVNVCVTLNLLILFMNIFTKWMYYFDSLNFYHRNTGWYVYTVLNVICILTITVMSIKYRKAVSSTMFIALLLYTFAPVIAIILQTFIYGISITNIGIFIAMIVMLLVYLREWSRIKTRNDKKRKSIEIVTLFIIMMISMSASIISCIVSMKQISDENSENSSMMIAHMVSDGIENEFLKPIIVAEMISNDYNLKQYMEKSNEGYPEQVEKEIATYLESIRTGFGYQMLFVVCDESKAYYTYDGITRYIDIESSDHDIWYKMYLEEGKHYDLNVNTDNANHWESAVFINTDVTDEAGNFLGICGVGVEMISLQNFLKDYEERYHIKINLIDSDGVIQVDTDTTKVEQNYQDSAYLTDISSEEFVYERHSETCRMTKYMKDMGWYLVVEDYNPDKINIMHLVLSSLIIFVIGLIMMGIVFFIIYIREKKAAKEIEVRRKLSITDDLTGLFNHRAYEKDCLKILESESLSDITIIMMDLNGLKTMNDTYGHIAGDELIIGAAKCMQTSMGEYGKVYRIGGDEFVALLKCTKHELDDMLHTFDHTVGRWKGNVQCKLSISKGIVVAAEHADLNFDELKELADKLMYENKDEFYKQTGKVHRKNTNIYLR